MSNQRQGSVMLKNRSAVRVEVENLGDKKEQEELELELLEVHYGLAEAAFAHTKNHDKKINKKMAKKALASILSKFKTEKD